MLREFGMCPLRAAAPRQSGGRVPRALSTSKDSSLLACPRAAPPSEVAWELQGDWIPVTGNCLLLVPTAKDNL